MKYEEKKTNVHLPFDVIERIKKLIGNKMSNKFNSRVTGRSFEWLKNEKYNWLEEC